MTEKTGKQYRRWMEPIAMYTQPSNPHRNRAYLAAPFRAHDRHYALQHTMGGNPASAAALVAAQQFGGVVHLRKECTALGSSEFRIVFTMQIEE